MSWFLTATGAALILLTLREIFHTLWHPRGFGSLAKVIFVATWRIARALRIGRSLELAGPLALMATAAAWTLGLVVGFALIYLSQMPEEFIFASPLQPERSSDVVASLYLSAVTLVTLGIGDIAPAEPWLRLLVPLEGLVGFVLLTAVISWVLQLYPALGRRRALARHLASMAVTDTAGLIPGAEPSVAVQLLESVRSQLATCEVDLAQYAESYYFHETERDLSLAAQLPYVPLLIEAANSSSAREVRHTALVLEHGLGRLTDLIAGEFFRGDAAGRAETSQVLPTYAADHRQDLA